MRVVRGLTDSGVDVYDIRALQYREGVYFATFHESLDGRIVVTASHNPPDYNGMKMVREQASRSAQIPKARGYSGHRRTRRVCFAAACRAPPGSRYQQRHTSGIF